ncbi:MAG: Ribonuclease protein component [Candidatus Adlerbacteria bacterium]|nr:Ribonuclease protein component [Candidatus Adlerbacteria bacterium]
MLSRNHRLRSGEVRDIIKAGTSGRAGYLSVKYVVFKGPYRCAAVISKKLAKTAVLRNSVRRSLYTALRVHPLPSDTSAVFFVHKLPPTPRTAAFAQDIAKLFHN